MKIAIDARFLGPEGTGIGKYVEKLIENLEELDKQNSYFIVLKKSNFHFFNSKNPNFEKILVDAHWYTPKEQILMPIALRKINPDLVHFPHFNIPLGFGGKFVVTIHDLIKSEFKEAAANPKLQGLYDLKHLTYQFILSRALKKSKAIITPSNFVKGKLVETQSVDPEKVTVTHEAADGNWKVEASEGQTKNILAKYGIKKPFIIYVGNAFPYKNVSRVLECLLFLKKHQFVYASARSYYVDDLVKRAEELGVRDRFIVTGYVLNEELAVLLKNAECLVFPSLSEGFGLPGLEAMAAGCPVVCSDIPVFREVYQDAVMYFDPLDAADIGKKIERLGKNSKIREELIKKGEEQMKKYSWRELASKTLTVYRSILQ